MGFGFMEQKQQQQQQSNYYSVLGVHPNASPSELRSAYKKLAMVGRAVLINSVILPISTYQMSCVAVPDSIVDALSKLARNFLWGGSCNRSGFHTMGWSTTTLDKSDGGLGVRNLRIARTALMAKNVFMILNSEDKLWVNIFNMKYGTFNVWTSKPNKNCSSFARALCSAAAKIKSECWIKECNPQKTDFFKDPWFFDIPVGFKPTFLNMSIQRDSFSVDDFVINGAFNQDLGKLIFGENVSSSHMANWSINRGGNNYWVWNPVCSTSSIVSSIYNWINCDPDDRNGKWDGWNTLWRLNTLPRVKLFIWRVLHGRTPTFAYLYKLNIGPARECCFCGIELESDDHVLWKCHKTKLIWNNVSLLVNVDLSVIDGLSDGVWITRRWSARCGDQNFKAILATCAWLVWRARCGKVFNSKEPNWLDIGKQAVNLVMEFVQELKLNTGKLSHFPFQSSLCLFTDAAWINQDGCCGTGFILVDSNQMFILAGAKNTKAESSTHAECIALEEALKLCVERRLFPSRIYSDCKCLVDLLIKDDSVASWRMSDCIMRVKRLIEVCDDAQVELIPRNLNHVADMLAKDALKNPAISLFHRGLDVPSWLMEAACACNIKC